MPTTFEASAVMEYGFAGGPTGRNQFQHVAASADYGFDVIPTAGRLREFSALVSIEYGFESVVTGDNSSRATTLTARDVIGDVFKLWGLCCDNADDFDPCIRTEALQAVNAALQFIHANGKALPYLSSRTRGYFISDSSPYAELESDVQNVEGYVRAVPAVYLEIEYTIGPPSPTYPQSPFTSGNGVTLIGSGLGERIYAASTTPAELQAAIQADINNGATCYVTDVASTGVDPTRVLTIYFDSTPVLLMDSTDYETLTRWYIGENYVSFSGSLLTQETTQQAMPPLGSRYEYDNYTALYGADAPVAYWLERKHQDVAEATKSQIYLAAADAGITCVRLDVGIQAQRLEWNDFLNRTEVPIPHQYVESLLIPIARWYASASRSYKQKERHAVLIEQYQQALAMLGMVDPKPAGKPAKDGGSEE